MPPLSAEVEDGALQIAAEALTNIARHSDATAAVLRVYIDRSLHIEILDNGTPAARGLERVIMLLVSQFWLL